MIRIDGAVLQHQYFKSIFNSIHGIAANAVQRGFQPAWFSVGAEIALQCFCLEDACIDTADLFQFMIGEHRMFQCYGMAAQRIFLQQVTVITNKSGRGSSPFFHGWDRWADWLPVQTIV